MPSPDEWMLFEAHALYSISDIPIKSRVPTAHVERAIANGQLGPVIDLTRDGGSRMIKGSNINAWLYADAPDSPASKPAKGGRPNQGAAASSTTFAQAVDAKVAHGMSRAAAAREVAREQPDLRESAIAAANERPGPVERHVNGNSFAAAVDAKVLATGLDRPAAARAIAREQPQLREQAIAAANA